jgi:hypothetical protein
MLSLFKKGYFADLSGSLDFNTAGGAKQPM